MQQEKAIGTEKTKKDDIKLCNGWNRPTQREKKKKKESQIQVHVLKK
jgi:hypothetical protein